MYVVLLGCPKGKLGAPLVWRPRILVRLEACIWLIRPRTRTMEHGHLVLFFGTLTHDSYA